MWGMNASLEDPRGKWWVPPSVACQTARWPGPIPLQRDRRAEMRLGRSGMVRDWGGTLLSPKPQHRYPRNPNIERVGIQMVLQDDPNLPKGRSFTLASEHPLLPGSALRLGDLITYGVSRRKSRRVTRNQDMKKRRILARERYFRKES